MGCVKSCLRKMRLSRRCRGQLICKDIGEKEGCRHLLKAIIEQSKVEGIWTLQGCTLRENAASLALQRKCGFRKVGYRERIGQVNDVWKDVILMERRSKVAGV